jgi:hypothetical protein
LVRKSSVRGGGIVERRPREDLFRGCHVRRKVPDFSGVWLNFPAQLSWALLHCTDDGPSHSFQNFLLGCGVMQYVCVEASACVRHSLLLSICCFVAVCVRACMVREIPPRKPPMPHDDGSATDRASAWRARRSSTDCTQRAVSPPGRTAACACDCVGLGGLFSSSFLQRPGPTVAAFTGLPGARATLLWHPLLRRVVEYQHQVIVDLQTGVDCTQRAVSPPGRTAACATLCLWRVGTFSKKGWSSLLLAPNEVTAPEAGDSHTGADCSHVAESWNRAHSDTMQRARQGDLHRVPRLWLIAVTEYTATR